MNDATRHLLDEALRLPLAEREELLAQLQASFEENDGEWLEELERRAKSDPANDRPWSEVLARIDAKYGYK